MLLSSQRQRPVSIAPSLHRGAASRCTAPPGPRPRALHRARLASRARPSPPAHVRQPGAVDTRTWRPPTARPLRLPTLPRSLLWTRDALPSFSKRIRSPRCALSFSGYTPTPAPLHGPSFPARVDAQASPSLLLLAPPLRGPSPSCRRTGPAA